MASHVVHTTKQAVTIQIQFLGYLTSLRPGHGHSIQGSLKQTLFLLIFGRHVKDEFRRIYYR